MSKGQTLLNYLLLLAPFPESTLDDSWDDDCDHTADVMRLLVEKGRLELIDSEVVLIVVTAYYSKQRSYNFPILEYLTKQEVFDFSWSEICVYIGSQGCRVFDTPFFHKSSISSFLRIFLNSGGEVNLSIDDDKENNPIALAVAVRILTSEFTECKKQREAFNDAVIAFCLLFKHGLDPFATFMLGDGLRSLRGVTNVDPHFTSVAWRLAVQLHSWGTMSIMPSIAWAEATRDDISVDAFAEVVFKVFLFGDLEDASMGTYSTESPGCGVASDTEYPSENSDEDEKEQSEEEENCGEEDREEENEAQDEEDEQRIPGAWVRETPDQWLDRKFHSKFTDFTGVVDGHKWDPKLYLRLETVEALRKY